jgi:hypothetical protein
MMAAERTMSDVCIAIKSDMFDQKMLECIKARMVPIWRS